ncbi:MAG: M3 family oligoendopeptidase [Anaerolineae bacterium]|nr:M3 family oligoendopeptidase [Anaerolineae bacterium]
MTTNSSTHYTQQAWSLADLFPAIKSEAVTDALAELDSLISHFETFQSKLNDDLNAADFQTMLDSYETIGRKMSCLSGFSGLSFAADTQNQEAQNFMARINQRYAESSNRTLFFELWWKAAPEETVNRLLKTAGEYRYWLETLRREVPHTLSEAEERIINLKNVNGRSALDQLYDSITNRYTFALQIDGETKTMTRGELSTYFFANDPAQRQAAYQELNRVYASDAPILGQIYQALVRDWRSENLDLRHFETPIATRNLGNDIPDEVVDTLLSVVRENKGIIQRYFKLKAKWLGLDKLPRYDIYAPVVGSEQTYPFAEAAAIVLQSFQEFDPHIAQLAERVFAENHLDSEVRPGKRSGAFCATPVPDCTPWVLQSYQGKVENVTTLAHELGHAMHSMLAEHHNVLNQHPSLPLAETASNFAEMLLVDRLLQDADEETRRSLMFDEVEKGFKSILRQSYFALFERDAHEAIHNGASVDEISALYLANLKEQFGDAVDVSDDFQYEWLSIPHIYKYPFYVYAYAFGHLLVLALYEQYRQEGEPFKARYLKILAAGGSEAPATILENAGIDIYAAEFWQGGFDVLAKRLDELEQMPVKAFV